MKIGYQQANIAETLGIHPYRVKLAMQQARGFGEKQLAELYNELIENDYLVKKWPDGQRVFVPAICFKTWQTVSQKKGAAIDDCCAFLNLLILQFFYLNEICRD